MAAPARDLTAHGHGTAEGEGTAAEHPRASAVARPVRPLPSLGPSQPAIEPATDQRQPSEERSHLPRFLRIGDAGITDPGRLPPKSRVALAEVVGMPNSNASDYATVSQQATQCFQLSKVQNYRCLIACRPCFGSNCTFLMQKLNKVTGACVQISTQANKKFISWKNRPRISRG